MGFLSAIGNPGQFWGTNNIIGNAVNDVTGVSSSARAQFANQKALQKDAQNFAKWQMQNAHQTEIKDLQEAGLNPVLSANAGASAGVTEGSASVGTSGADPIAMAGQIINMMNSSKQTKAQVENLEQQNEKIDTDINNETRLTNAKIRNLDAETGKTNYNTNLDKENNINGNTPYPVKLIKMAKSSARKEMQEWKDKENQKGWKGWKYKARNWIFNQ